MRPAPVCDRNCFECPYPDCISDELTAADYRDAAALEIYINPPSAKQIAIAAKQREYYEANRDAIAAKKREYYEANRDAIAAKQREYYEANRDAIAAKQREYYEANRDAIAAKQREYYEANRDAIAAKRREYYEANRDAIAAKRREYREANRDAIAAKQREYREANRDAIAAKKREYMPEFFRRNRAAADRRVLWALRRCRKDHGCTQRDLAHLLGVHQTTVCGWETGRSPVDVTFVAQVMPELPAYIETAQAPGL